MVNQLATDLSHYTVANSPVLQTFDSLPVDLFHWGAAVLPIAVLLVLLIGLRWPADAAAAVAMFLAVAIALTVFRSPLITLAVAVGKGVWSAIFVLYVVWAALLLYLITDRAGALYTLRKGIERISSNDLFLVLAFGWVFVSFLQGITGFGTPIAIVAPLLLALGVRPVYAVAMPLIGHAWNNTFGTLAVAWYGTRTVVDLQAPIETALQTAMHFTIITIAGGFAVAWLYGRWKAIAHAWPMIVILGAIQSITLVTTVVYSQFIAGLLASTIALVALYPISRWDRFGTQHEPFERPAMDVSMTRDGHSAPIADGGESVLDTETGGGTARVRDEGDPEPVMSFFESLLPYIVLTAIALVSSIPSVSDFLGRFQVGFAFPAVETAFVRHTAADPYSPFSFFTHPGTIVLIGVLVGWVVYRDRGYYDAWQRRVADSPQFEAKPSIRREAIANGVPASLAIILLVIISRVMLDTGQIRVLALGIAAALPGAVYLFGANSIGVLGAFITGSNTASNILFAPLQAETAAALNLPEWTVLGAQMSGGGLGNAIAPANVVLGTGTAGIVGREGEVLRITLKWTVLVSIVLGIVTMVLSRFVFLGGGA
ncbi:MAG: L-lactate permease [Haloferacaceae archaeon]